MTNRRQSLPTRSQPRPSRLSLAPARGILKRRDTGIDDNNTVIGVMPVQSQQIQQLGRRVSFAPERIDIYSRPNPQTESPSPRRSPRLAAKRQMMPPTYNTASPTGSPRKKKLKLSQTPILSPQKSAPLIDLADDDTANMSLTLPFTIRADQSPLQAIPVTQPAFSRTTLNDLSNIPKFPEPSRWASLFSADHSDVDDMEFTKPLRSPRKKLLETIDSMSPRKAEVEDMDLTFNGRGEGTDTDIARSLGSVRLDGRRNIDSDNDSDMDLTRPMNDINGDTREDGNEDTSADESDMEMTRAIRSQTPGPIISLQTDEESSDMDMTFENIKMTERVMKERNGQEVRDEMNESDMEMTRPRPRPIPSQSTADTSDMEITKPIPRSTAKQISNTYSKDADQSDMQITGPMSTGQSRLTADDMEITESVQRFTQPTGFTRSAAFNQPTGLSQSTGLSHSSADDSNMEFTRPIATASNTERAEPVVDDRYTQRTRLPADDSIMEFTKPIPKFSQPPPTYPQLASEPSQPVTDDTDMEITKPFSSIYSRSTADISDMEITKPIPKTMVHSTADDSEMEITKPFLSVSEKQFVSEKQVVSENQVVTGKQIIPVEDMELTKRSSITTKEMQLSIGDTSDMDMTRTFGSKSLGSRSSSAGFFNVKSSNGHSFNGQLSNAQLSNAQSLQSPLRPRSNGTQPSGTQTHENQTNETPIIKHSTSYTTANGNTNQSQRFQDISRIHDTNQSHDTNQPHDTRRPHDSLINQPQNTPLTSSSDIRLVTRDQDIIRGRTISNTEYNNVTVPVFLSKIGIEFMDTFLAGRKNHSSIGLNTNIIENDNQTPKLIDHVIAGSSKLPLLNMYEFASKELKADNEMVKESFAQWEKDTANDNPVLFQEFMEASPATKEIMKSQFQLLKSYSREEAKCSWYVWRTQLTRGVKKEIERNLEKLKADVEILKPELLMARERYETSKETKSKLQLRVKTARKRLSELRARRAHHENEDKDQHSRLKENVRNKKQDVRIAQSSLEQVTQDAEQVVDRIQRLEQEKSMLVNEIIPRKQQEKDNFQIKDHEKQYRLILLTTMFKDISVDKKSNSIILQFHNGNLSMKISIYQDIDLIYNENNPIRQAFVKSLRNHVISMKSDNINHRIQFINQSWFQINEFCKQLDKLQISLKSEYKIDNDKLDLQWKLMDKSGQLRQLNIIRPLKPEISALDELKKWKLQYEPIS